MDALLAMIVTWLSVQFELPPTQLHPKIEIVSAREIVFRRYRAFSSEVRREAWDQAQKAAVTGKGRQSVAIYDDANHVISLPEGWTGHSPAELSVLIHEVVHHLQAVHGLKYECLNARERLAYDAQDRWLAMFGLSLASEFDIDAFTLKVSTACGM
jgi:hypothetical protein